MSTTFFIACKMFFNRCQMVHEYHTHFFQFLCMIFNTSQADLNVAVFCDVLKNMWKNLNSIVMHIQHLTAVKKNVLEVVNDVHFRNRLVKSFKSVHIRKSFSNWLRKPFSNWYTFILFILFYMVCFLLKHSGISCA